MRYLVSVECHALVVKDNKCEFTLGEGLFQKVLKRGVTDGAVKTVQIDTLIGILLAFVGLVVGNLGESGGFMKGNVA